MSLHYNSNKLDLSAPPRLAEVPTQKLLGPVALTHFSTFHVGNGDLPAQWAPSFASADLVAHEHTDWDADAHKLYNDVAQGKQGKTGGWQTPFYSVLHDNIANTRVPQEIWDINQADAQEKGLEHLLDQSRATYTRAHDLLSSNPDGAKEAMRDSFLAINEILKIRDEIGKQRIIRLANQHFKDAPSNNGEPLKIVQWAGAYHVFQPISLAAVEGMDVSIHSLLEDPFDSVHAMSRKYLENEPLTEQDIIRNWAAQALIGSMSQSGETASHTLAVQRAHQTLKTLSDKEAWDQVLEHNGLL